MVIKGANLGFVEGEFRGLSKHELVNNSQLKSKVRMLERLYYNLYERARNSEVTPMSIDENNQVIIKPYMVNHSCASDFENLKSISQYGVLASEWFGLLESEREGCFCTFVSRMKDDEYQYRGDLAEDNYSRLNIGRGVLLFFDETNPIMQYLLHLDYFEFEHIKETSPESIHQIYTKEEIDLLENLIEPLSPGGRNMRSNHTSKSNYWSAIPGGIPPFLINGICIKRNKYSDEELDELSKLYPNAVIFNSRKEVIRYPYKLEEEILRRNIR